MTMQAEPRRACRHGQLALALFAALGLSCRSAGGVAPTAGAAAPAPAPTPPTDAAPAAIAYRPYHASYRAVTHGRVEQEFSGQVTASDFTMHYYVTARLEPGDSIPRLILTLDSVPVLQGTAMGFSASEAARAQGATFTGTLAPTGEILDFAGGDTSITLVQQLASRLRQFFPRIPAAGVHPGATWVDTTESASTSSGLKVTITSVNQHEAADWAERPGGRALHIRSVSVYTMSGSGAQGAQRFTIQGTGVRRGHEYLSADGRYLGYTASDTSHATAEVADMGIVIPIVQTRSDTVSVVP